MLVLTENFITLSSLRGRRKKVRGGGGRKVRKQKGPLPSLPILPPFSPSSLSPTSPTPFNACYSGHTLSLEPHIIHVGPTHF